MLRILDAAPNLGAAPQERHRSPPNWTPLVALGAIRAALHEGLAMHREYEALRSKGVAHDAARRQALAIGPAPSRQTRVTIAPLYFAGKA